MAQQAQNNNTDGQNVDAFDWDGFSNKDVVGGTYLGNYSLMPSNVGVCGIQASKDYDDVCNGDDKNKGNMHNRNDDECNSNVQNGNNEETPNNTGTGDDV